MKKYLTVTAAILLVTAFASAQGKSKSSTVTTTQAAPAFVREKFDPAKVPQADLDKAIETASKDGRRIILDVGGEWCGWCIYMDKFLFQNAELDRLRNANYVWVKINMSEENDNKAFLSAYPEISGYPHLFVLDEKGKLLESKDTSELEEGKGYNLVRFTEFLQKWAVKK